MRITSMISAAILMGAVSAKAQWTQSVPAPITGIAYKVTYSRRNAADRVVSSEMTFDVSGTGAVVLSLPAWTPGEYEITNFSRNISSFAATENGADLTWEKMDPDSWRVHPSRAGKVKVSFDYQADTLDNGSSW